MSATNETNDQKGRTNTSFRIVRLLVIASVLSLTICIVLIQSSSTIVVSYKEYRAIQETSSSSAVDTSDPASTNEQEDYPKIAWLLSFPNSGTSFTMTQVKKVSHTTTASNYAKEIKDKEKLVPVNPTKSKYGPFAYESNFPGPESYVLTKTHCGGYAAKTLQVLSSFDFLKECAHVKFDDPKYHDKFYHPRIIDKTIHLVRNPFDNIVSRFHLETHRALKDKDKGERFVKKYPNNREGFRNWCAHYDRNLNSHTTHTIHRFLNDVALDGVLCYLEFFKYVHWHNNAFKVSEMLNIPSLILHYEEYHQDYNATEANILEFLNLEKKEEGNLFHMSNYDEYFTFEDKKNITEFIYAIASSRTLAQLNTYYLSSF